jgi:AcrR family transcriptional regulator
MADSQRSANGIGDAIDAIIGRYFRREPKQSRSRAVVAAVIEATDELIRRGAPIDEVTIERVTERAGIGLGSFYEYFSSKDSVLGVLIGKVTRSNFEDLSRKLEALEPGSLEDLVRAFSRSVAETYLAHPNRTRVIIEAAGRLGLAGLVHEEKDRFAEVMAVRVARFLPGEPLEAVTATMRLVADAGMGLLAFTAMRGGRVELERATEDLAALAIATIEHRHAAAVRAS